MPEPQQEAHAIAPGCGHHTPGEACTKCGVRLFSVCAALDGEDLMRLDRLARHTKVPAKTILFEQGEPAEHVYNVVSGTIRLFKLLPDGRRQIVGFALPGDFLGLSLAETNAYGAEVIDDSDLCQFDRAQMSQFSDENKQLMHRLHEFISHELVIAQDQMVILGRLHAEERVAVFLLGMYDRFKNIGRKSVTIPLPMVRADIADYLGLTVETVSRTISRMGREKIILVVPDGIRILDMDRLKALGG
ncbi:MAG: helix-turn-helix domain-containing protein [Hyphomicrobiales bacterium]|nr:helix-turn-helix domain-containing protein [Hyphomicrobiales bacterium]